MQASIDYFPILWGDGFLINIVNQSHALSPQENRPADESYRNPHRMVIMENTESAHDRLLGRGGFQPVIEWRGAGVAEQGCLLSSCSGKTRAGGSNPPLSVFPRITT